MRCFQCDREAIGICRWCLLGQCEDHMRAGLEAHDRIQIMGCIHMFTGENTNLPRIAVPPETAAKR